MSENSSKSSTATQSQMRPSQQASLMASSEMSPSAEPVSPQAEPSVDMMALKLELLAALRKDITAC